MGSAKNRFCNLRVMIPGGFVNISAKTKILSKIYWGAPQGPRYYRFTKWPEFENLLLLSLWPPPPWHRTAGIAHCIIRLPDYMQACITFRFAQFSERNMHLERLPKVVPKIPAVGRQKGTEKPDIPLIGWLGTRIVIRAGHIALWNCSIALCSWANLDFGGNGAP